MRRTKIIEKSGLNRYQKQLIIDDNKEWGHDSKHSRISQYVTGDLHDFFDLLSDEQLFTSFDDQFDLIFIGEIMHVMTLQSIIFNLEHGASRLLPVGAIAISIGSNNGETSDVSATKAINRLSNLQGFELKSQITYTDDQAIGWTLLVLGKVEEKSITADSINDSLQIGKEIADFVNGGKNLQKLKTGYLKSNSKLTAEQFDIAFTTKEEVLSYYLLQSIIELQPTVSSQYANELSDLIWNNRKAIGTCDGKTLEVLKAQSFEQAVNNNPITSPDKSQIAEFALVINSLWNTSLKKKNDRQLQAAINNLD